MSTNENDPEKGADGNDRQLPVADLIKLFNQKNGLRQSFNNSASTSKPKCTAQAQQHVSASALSNSTPDLRTVSAIESELIAKANSHRMKLISAVSEFVEREKAYVNRLNRIISVVIPDLARFYSDAARLFPLVDNLKQLHGSFLEKLEPWFQEFQQLYAHNNAPILNLTTESGNLSAMFLKKEWIAHLKGFYTQFFQAKLGAYQKMEEARALAANNSEFHKAYNMHRVDVDAYVTADRMAQYLTCWTEITHRLPEDSTDRENLATFKQLLTEINMKIKEYEELIKHFVQLNELQKRLVFASKADEEQFVQPHRRLLLDEAVIKLGRKRRKPLPRRLLLCNDLLLLVDGNVVRRHLALASACVEQEDTRHLKISFKEDVVVLEFGDTCDEQQKLNRVRDCLRHELKSKDGLAFLLGHQAPEWLPDDFTAYCMHCHTHFNAFNRRHHCRACGRVVCNDCSKNSFDLAFTSQKDRICDYCFSVLKARAGEPSKPCWMEVRATAQPLLEDTMQFALRESGFAVRRLLVSDCFELLAIFTQRPQAFFCLPLPGCVLRYTASTPDDGPQSSSLHRTPSLHSRRKDSLQPPAPHQDVAVLRTDGSRDPILQCTIRFTDRQIFLRWRQQLDDALRARRSVWTEPLRDSGIDSGSSS